MSKIDWRKKGKAYDAMERDSLSGEPELVGRADAAMEALRRRTITADEFNHYVGREEDFRSIGGWEGEWVNGRKKTL